MSRILSKNAKPEMIVRRFLHCQGLRYRLHVKKLPSSPDIVLSKYRAAVLVNGCFWHGHVGCKHFRIPSTRREWWTSKIEANILRDSSKTKQLELAGWKVFTVWECNVKSDRKDSVLNKLLSKITANTPYHQKKYK